MKPVAEKCADESCSLLRRPLAVLADELQALGGQCSAAYALDRSANDPQKVREAHIQLAYAANQCRFSLAYVAHQVRGLCSSCSYKAVTGRTWQQALQEWDKRDQARQAARDLRAKNAPEGQRP